MEIKVIPANSRNLQKAEESRSLRVAAYCRVSTLLEEQESSYEAQIEHYTAYINGHDGWTLEGIYADEGISGTGVKKREEFNRMIARCMEGCIDLVITKSISRFARNTLDCIQYIRLLKEKNISIIFEKEAINTLDAQGEVLITILASLAQQESLSISQNIRMGIRYQYQQGKVRLNYNRFLGYTRNAAGELVIVPEEAKIVQRIYREFLDGKSPAQIAQGLTKDGIKTCTGKDRWYDKSIRSILRNEKYIGDALLQKEYIADYLTKRRSPNDGVLPKYYVTDDHPAIISRDDYKRAQEEFIRRREVAALLPGTSPYAFSGRMICSVCGGKYRRIKERGPQGATIWRCIENVHCAGQCTGRVVMEEEAQKAVLEVLDELAQINQTLPRLTSFQEAAIFRILERIMVTPDGYKIKLHGLEEANWLISPLV